MEVNAKYFAAFVTGGLELFGEYINEMRTDRCHGDDLEIMAACEIYERAFQIYVPDIILGVQLILLQPPIATNNEPFHVSYENKNHYNPVVPLVSQTIISWPIPGFFHFIYKTTC
jgi:hypothetical protein